MKIVVLGNCQSRPVTEFIKSSCPNAELMDPIISHLRSDADMESDYQAFESADIVFAQFVNDNYKVKHVATSRLISKFGKKVITWPNAFFIGQNPDVVVLRTESKSNVVGPLDTYHIRSIFKSWLQNQSAADCLSQLTKNNEDVDSIERVISTSFAELKDRERSLDVCISDFIENNWLDKKLFHVFNHPTNIVLVELANRLCDFAGIENRVSILPEFWSEHLNRVIVPSIRSINSQIGFNFEMSDSSKAFSLNYTDKGDVTLGGVEILSLERLVESFYRAYDCQISKSENYWFTPRYLHEEYMIDAAA